MPTFFFGVNTVTIRNTRSKHKDTNYVAFTMKVGVSTPQTLVKSLGNLNSGNFRIDLAFNSVDLEPGSLLVFNYLIVNAGSAKQAAAETALEAASIAWVSGQGPTSENLTGALQDGQTWFTDQLGSILNPDSCDGMVAAEQNHFTYESLTSLLGVDIFLHQTAHPGVKSPRGCGPNSQYVVTSEIFENGPLI